MDFSAPANNWIDTLDKSPLVQTILSAMLGSPWAVVPATPASHYKAYIYLSMAVYLFSNNLLELRMLDGICEPEQIRLVESLDAVFAAIPQRHLQALLHSRLASIRAAWEKFLIAAGRFKQPQVFKILVHLGILHNWFAGSRLGHDYLYFAASMNLVDIIQTLLGAGCRPDKRVVEFGGSDDPSSKSAITYALQCGHIRCAELMLKRCDVNAQLKDWPNPTLSNWGYFVHSLGYIETTLERGLELFLEAGADVDLSLYDLWLWRTTPSRRGPGYHYSHLGKFYCDWSREHEDAGSQGFWPSILDYVFYFHRSTFDRAASRSRALDVEVTRAGILLSLETGRQDLGDYLSTRTTQFDSRHLGEFLEIVLAEQLMIVDQHSHKRDTDLPTVRRLMDFGVRIDRALAHPVNPLDVSIGRIQEDGSENEIAVLEFLLSQGVTVKSDNLVSAVQARGIRLLEIMARHTMDLAQEGAMALARAASLNNMEAVDFFLDRGVDINSQVDDISILARAILQWHPTTEDTVQMVRCLVERGAHLGLHTERQDPIELLEYLLSTNSYGESHPPNLLATVQYIVDDVVGSRCFSPMPTSRVLESAAHRELLDDYSDGLAIFEHLFRHGAQLQPGSPLAAWIDAGGRAALVRDMLDAGADVNAYTRYYAGCTTPLQAAAAQWNPDVVLLLIHEGADVNAPAKGFCGKTALQASCRYHLGSGDGPGGASREHQMRTIQLLLDHGADVNAAPERTTGLTAMQEAAMLGDLGVAMLLLRHGADVNAPGCENRSMNEDDLNALDLAADGGCIDMVKLLLNANALSQNRGETGYDGAIERAEKFGHQAVAELIRQHAAEMENDEDLRNPYLSQPPRHWREYGYDSDADDGSEDSDGATDDSSNSAIDETCANAVHQWTKIVAQDEFNTGAAATWAHQADEMTGREVNRQDTDFQPVSVPDAGLEAGLDTPVDAPMDVYDFDMYLGLGGSDAAIPDAAYDDATLPNAVWRPDEWMDVNNRILELDADEEYSGEAGCVEGHVRRNSPDLGDMEFSW